MGALWWGCVCVCMRVCAWGGGEYHTDATGCIYISIPEARRVCVAVTRLTADSEAQLGIQWWLYCGLPGTIQTMSRGELYAIVMTIAGLAWYLTVMFVTDCLPLHDGIVGHRCTGANADLWCHLCELVDNKEFTVQVRWIKQHTWTTHHGSSIPCASHSAMYVVISQLMHWQGKQAR